MQTHPLLYIKIFVAVLIVGVLGFYFFHQSRAFLFGPKIVVNNLQNGQALNKSLVLIEGRVLNSVNLLINGQAVLTDDTGNFSKKHILANGYNIIELSAEDKFGRVANKKLELVFQPYK